MSDVQLQTDAPIDADAHAAATSPYNALSQPTDKQLESGNFKKGHVKIAGLNVTIEYPEYSIRSGTAADGTEWSITLRAHYGYITGTNGSDDEYVDVFIRPGTDSEYDGPVFIVNQVDQDGNFDEHKALIGWLDEESAKAGYLANYATGWTGLGSIVKATLDQFKEWLEEGNLKKAARIIISDDRLMTESTDGETMSKKTAPVAAEVEVEDATLTAAARKNLRAGQYAVPGKKKLPIHDAAHVRNAWARLNQTEGLTTEEKATARKRIIAAAKRFGIKLNTSKVATGKKKAVKDDAADIPDDMSIYEFMQALQEELRETQPQWSVFDCYPGGDAPFIVARMKIVQRSEWDGTLYETYSSENYKIPYTITDTDDGDGDIDEVNITFGEATEIRMVPKEIDGDGDEEIEDANKPKAVAAAAAQASVPNASDVVIMTDSTSKVFVDYAVPMRPVILSDDADKAAGRVRIRLPGPKANTINGNNRMYPRRLLEDAFNRANRVAGNGSMIAYHPHPESYTGADGTVQFKTDLTKRAALVNKWFMDESGQGWVDYTLYDSTAAGKTIKESVDMGAAIGTSLRAVGRVKIANHDGKRIQIADSLDILSNDFVDNPALSAAWGRAQVLTDEAAELLVATAETPETEAPKEQVPFPIKDNSAETQTNSEKESGTIMDESTKTPAAPAEAVPITEEMAKQFFAASGFDPDELAEVITEKRESKRKAGVTAYLDAAFAGNEVEYAGKKQSLDLSRFSDDERQMIMDNCMGATPETIAARLENAVDMLGRVKAREKLRGRGYESAEGGGEGKSVVEVLTDEQDKAIRGHVDTLLDKMMEYGENHAKTKPNHAVIEANKPFVDKMMKRFLTMEDKHHRPVTHLMADAAKDFLTRPMNLLDAIAVVDDATTTSNLSQQPVITPATTALIMQIYWQLSWLDFVGGIGPEGFGAAGQDAAIGENLRLPIETRPSGADTLFVGEGQPINTIHTLLRWLTFAPKWKKVAFDLTKESQVQLERGAARYDALARQLYLLSQVVSERIDIELANEHLNASDEYLPGVVTAETPSTLITSSTVLAAMGYSTTTVKSAIQTSTAAAVDSSASVTFSKPIVPPRTVQVLQADGSQQPTTLNPASAKFGSTALVMGLLDSNGNIVDDPEGTPGAQCAIDFENGVFLFTAVGTTPGTPGGGAATNSGVDATHLPTLAYSYTTNYDIFDLGPSADAADPSIFYDGLLRRIRATASQMGSQPRFRAPSDVILNLITSTYAESARMAAKLFQPAGSEVRVTGPRPNSFGVDGTVTYNKVNTPWRAGSNRMLLGDRRATKYGIQYPFTAEGPYMKEAVVVDASTPSGYSTKPTGNKFWIAAQNAVIATPIAYDLDGSGNQIPRNHPFRTIRFVGTAKL
jgi:hypothetical protein